MKIKTDWFSVEGSLDNLLDIGPPLTQEPDDISSPQMIEGRLSPVSLMAARGSK